MASTAKKASAPKKSAAKAPSHPPYIEMVKEALVALKERTGSSTYAIAKHIEEQQKVGLPSNFKKLLSVQLKKSVASGKLVKVKNSYKLAPAEKKSAEEPKPKAKPVVKPKAAAEKVAKKPAAKPKAAAVKPKKAAPAKAKAKTVTKPKAVAKPAKAVKAVRVVAKSPAKKVAATKAKKVVEKAKKPKSIKSPAKKAPVAKKAKK